MAENLLPCPWCGSTDIYADASDICCPIQWSAVARCRGCGAQEPDGSGVYDLKADAERVALTAWNVRASSNQRDDALTLLRGIVNSDVGVQTRHKLEEGQGVNTESGKTWLAAIEFVKQTN